MSGLIFASSINMTLSPESSRTCESKQVDLHSSSEVVAGIPKLVEYDAQASKLSIQTSEAFLVLVTWNSKHLSVLNVTGHFFLIMRPVVGQ